MNNKGQKWWQKHVMISRLRHVSVTGLGKLGKHHFRDKKYWILSFRYKTASLLLSFWLTLLLSLIPADSSSLWQSESDSLWLFRALPGTHRLTRSLLSSLCRSCVALVYPALVGAVFISTEGALRLPKTSDNHPSNQPNPILTYSIKTTSPPNWSELT